MRPPRRVLLVSPHFPPDSTAGTHRARLLAPRLSEHGWAATVLTVDSRDYEGALDPVLAESVPADLRVVRSRASLRVQRAIAQGGALTRERAARGCPMVDSSR